MVRFCTRGCAADRIFNLECDSGGGWIRVERMTAAWPIECDAAGEDDPGAPHQLPEYEFLEIAVAGNSRVTRRIRRSRDPDRRNRRRVAGQRGFRGRYRRQEGGVIRGIILSAQKDRRRQDRRGEDRPSKDQRASGEQTPATSGHSHPFGNECLLEGFWETDAILVGACGACSDGCHEEPVD